MLSRTLESVQLVLVIQLLLLITPAQKQALAQPEERVTRYVEARDAQSRRVGENAYEYEVRERLYSGTALRVEIDDRPIGHVEVRLRREDGGSRTYVKLGFDPDRGFENNKRADVASSDLQTLTWDGEGRVPRDRPLTLSAFNGDIYVDSVTVHFVEERFAQDERRGRMGYDRYGRKPEEEDAARRCERINIREPDFIIQNQDQMLSALSGLLTGSTPLEGELEGQCITEAGYYRNGQLVQRIDFRLDDRMDRRRFTLQINPNENGELRAYTTDGRSEVVPLQEAIRRKR